MFPSNGSTAPARGILAFPVKDSQMAPVPSGEQTVSNASGPGTANVPTNDASDAQDGAPVLGPQSVPFSDSTPWGEWEVRSRA